MKGSWWGRTARGVPPSSGPKRVSSPVEAVANSGCWVGAAPSSARDMFVHVSRRAKHTRHVLLINTSLHVSLPMPQSRYPHHSLQGPSRRDRRQYPDKNHFPDSLHTSLHLSDREPPNIRSSLAALTCAGPLLLEQLNAPARKTPSAHRLIPPGTPGRVADPRTRPAMPGASRLRSASSASTRSRPRRPCPCPAGSPSTASAQG